MSSRKSAHQDSSLAADSKCFEYSAAHLSKSVQLSVNWSAAASADYSNSEIWMIWKFTKLKAWLICIGCFFESPRRRHAGTPPSWTCNCCNFWWGVRSAPSCGCSLGLKHWLSLTGLVFAFGDIRELLQMLKCHSFCYGNLVVYPLV
jgi:hypothetical protein